MSWKLILQFAVAFVISVLIIALFIGAATLAEFWLAGAIALEPHVGFFLAGLLMACPVVGLVYVLMYGVGKR